jgi:Family of unknown function (DUF6519)
MKGDFTRVTFDAARHFSRVLMQQGRVTVDADPNEQSAILLHYVRTLARDLIGPCGGPVDALGFALDIDPSTKPATLTIGAGRYYVDGILCENEAPCSYVHQPDFTPAKGDALVAQLEKPTAQAFWLYLDVWETHVTAIEDDRIREVALGGPDTCTRAKVVWQVKALAHDPPPAAEDNTPEHDDACSAPLGELPAASAALLAAELDPGQQIKDPCVIAPDARFRGAENQLYRVEIHHGGAAGGEAGATFKWSRDNGSVASAWLGTEGNDLIVASARGFSAGAWVELSDDRLDLRGEPGTLVKVVAVDGNRLSVDPDSLVPGASIAWTTALDNPKGRRWDQTENDDIKLNKADRAIPIVEATDDEPSWIDLEDGVRVRFASSDDDASPIQYHSGDYWLIPARVATGDIEWPRTDGGGGGGGGSTADFLPPRGIEHHFAPLGWLTSDPAGKLSVDLCLCTLQPLSHCKRPVAAAKVVPPRHLAPAQPKGPRVAPAVPVKPKVRKPK